MVKIGVSATMEEFFKSLTSPVWWLSVVIVGVIISVVGAYLKVWIDKFFSLLSSAWKLRVEQEKLKANELLQQVQNSDRTLIMLGFEENRFRQRSMLLSILSMLCLILVFQGQADVAYINYLPYLNVYGGSGMLFAYFQLKKVVKIKSIMYTVKFNPRDFI
jgi:hypothetical protein